jgi:hypothetical protein
MKMRSNLGLIREIDIKEVNNWIDKIFLSFDIDWAHDEVIDDVLQLLDEHQAVATLFATHTCSALKNILKSTRHEIGLHPNFNKLLKGEVSGKSYYSICNELKNNFPNATSVRSHSLCFGSLIQTAYERLGITHDSSIIIPYQNNKNPLFPWKMWDGLTRVPYFFCDYVTAMTTDASMKELVMRDGLKVFDFHPIHIFLNTESLDRYERTRPLHQNPRELIKHRYEGYGTRNRLLDLLAFGVKDVAVDTTGEDT